MRLIVILLLLGLAAPALGHDLRYEVARGRDAVVVRLYFAGTAALSFESYEVYRSGEKVPFQVGSTDALGRIVFVPDEPGEWRIKAFSEDGHGVDFSLSTARGGKVEKVEAPLIGRYPRVVTGVGLILGGFGLFELFVGRRRRTRDGG